LSTTGAKNILTLFHNLRNLTVVIIQPYSTGIRSKLCRDLSTRKAARAWVEGLVAGKIGVGFERVTIEIRRVAYPCMCCQDELSNEGWAPAHSSYTYEGENGDDDRLRIREERHGCGQRYADI